MERSDGFRHERARLTTRMLRELLPDRIAVAHPDLSVAALDEPSFIEPAGLLLAPP